MNEVLSKVTSQPTTSQEWASWLQTEEERSLKLYIDYPERLVSDSNQERQVVGDYAGREILELLQNANDAAAEADMRGRVRIELLADGLIVANEGAPFTRDGVASLRLANISPKRGRKRQTIGSKGLGFRAVLNWSKTPTIISDSLALRFSAAAAEKRQHQLEASSTALRRLIAEEQSTAGSLIVPLLAFPDFGSSSTNPERQTDSGALHERALALRRRAFTTVIAMPFDDSNRGFSQAVEQLAQLRPEVLLFARNIDRLEIIRTGQPSINWRHELSEGDVSVVHVGPHEYANGGCFESPPRTG